MITLSDVQVKFDQLTIFDHLQLEFESNKTHVLLGPSGCGKTTILRLISGLLKPTKGEIFLDDKNITQIEQKDRSSLLGFMVQEGGLFPHLTIRDNILLPGILHKKDLTCLKTRLKELVEMVQLDPLHLNRYPIELSGGQKQRAALIRALILDPPVLLMDEPMSALDPLVRMSLQKSLKVVFNELKKTVILVTHSLNEASFFAHETYLLNSGKIEQRGSFEEILKNPATEFARDFINSQVPLV
ncbi:hypothetical protein A9Q84_14005 [Halobacteriovorax marinus]|uniref:ABC transporter domain-containing protein n=1 Tax=Halobacteriovorax marinus TaxID=97084 RepID=A0A1Y5F9I0_9BACT|nr:hypothetical protein A9Q84_14005 [Halobacteriovorax marinus]